MTPYIPVPDPITPAWLTTVLREADLLAAGQVLSVRSAATGAFNSHTRRLRLRYSADAAPGLAPRMVLKQNIQEPWGIEASAEEVKFYQVAATLQPTPPALVSCYAAASDPASGNSYLLLQDLSETHAPPITRDQQISIVDGVPSDLQIERVIDTLAQHHAYWWDHPLLATQTFEVGYWSRNADRFAQYLQRRQKAWESLLSGEASWFPDDIRNLYQRALTHLERHWRDFLEPRFRTRTHLTLLHGDAYFANFLCPKGEVGGGAYLLDWQSPTADIAGYDLANLCATFWTSAQRHEAQREQNILRRYHTTLQACGVRGYSWENLITDYQSGLIYWLLVPVQDRFGGSPKAYWWPKMQCLASAFREWNCAPLLGMAQQ
jgi:hypothetical protein